MRATSQSGSANPNPNPNANANPNPTLTVTPTLTLTKSSLLCALLGELRAVADADAQAEGRPETKVCRSAGAVGYFAQTPFILNETLRENILLGAPMDEP